MNKGNPLISCISLVSDWDELTTYWSDQFYGALLKDNPLLKIDKFYKSKIDSLVENTFKKVSGYYTSLITDSERIDFIRGIQEQSKDLYEKFKAQNNKTEHGKYAKETLKKLTYHMHYKYDETLFVLLQKEKNSDAQKLKMNLNRTELVHLFTLMKDSNIIQKVSDYAIAAFLENNFTYCNENDENRPLTRIEDYIRKIRNGEQYSETAILKIQEKISDGEIKIH